MKFEYSEDQQKALERLLNWFNKKDSLYITLGGYAGTGKTTLMSLFREQINESYEELSVAFCAYTGKATRVLKNKLLEQDTIMPNDAIGTIHSLIYSPMLNDKEEIIGWEKKNKIDVDLIVVDEASMVDQNIWNDLLTYKVPIIAVGDHGQLPPINGKFNLMENPEIRLENIFRQAKDNPIIEISIMARESGVIPKKFYGYNIMKVGRGTSESQETIGELLQQYTEDTLILCGYNTTRVKLNKFVRQNLDFETPYPEYRDRVICLRNNHQKEIFNGMLGTIKSISSEPEDYFYNTKIQMDDESSLYSGLISKEQFNNVESLNFTQKRSENSSVDLFDFGYALTVHKAQGSQSKRVVIFEERFKQMDDEMWRRWLYTAVTRAESELFIVG